MHCHSGGWLGMEAIAAKAKMWKREPAGRCRHLAITREQPPATSVVASTCSQLLAAAEAAGVALRAVSVARSITRSMSAPGPDLDERTASVQLAAAVNPCERAEGRKDRQIQAVQQHEGDQRHEDPHCAPARRRDGPCLPGQR